jgi:hypothetical protein
MGNQQVGKNEEGEQNLQVKKKLNVQMPASIEVDSSSVGGRPEA